MTKWKMSEDQELQLVHHIPSTWRVTTVSLGLQGHCIETRDNENEKTINIARVQHLRD